MTKIKPLGENVLVKISPKEKKTSGGLYIPETTNEEKPQEGIIAAVGDSKKINVKKNQRVIFARYSGTEFKVDKEEYLIIKNEDILAILE